MRKILLAFTVLGIATTLGLTSCEKEQSNVTPNGVATTQPQEVNSQEKQSLTFVREEEKMARDVYTTLFGKWPGLTFLPNISASEQKHMDKVLDLLNKYGIPDPVGTNGAGVFTSVEVQQLYNDFVSKGEVSELDALYVGMTIEDMDIYDLQQAILLVEKEDIKTAYGNLMNASKNHMREFYAQLKSRGSSYSPQYITQQEYEDIINSPKQHGHQ